MDLEDFKRRIAELATQPDKRGRPKKDKPAARKTPRRTSGHRNAGQMQTNNSVKAIYEPDKVKTPLRRTKDGLTLDIGGSTDMSQYFQGRNGQCWHGRAVIDQEEVKLCT